MSWKDRFPEFSNVKESLEELLLSGKIPDERYINWASETFKIPALAADFFNQASNFKLILENPSPLWNSSFFPVHEWQGMLYIACLEPQPVSLKKKHCLVLGPYKSMKALWDKMEKPAGFKEAPRYIAAQEIDDEPSTSPNIEAPAILRDSPVQSQNAQAAPQKPAAAKAPQPPVHRATTEQKPIPTSANANSESKVTLPDDFFSNEAPAPIAVKTEEDPIDADPFSASVIIPLVDLEKMRAEQAELIKKSQEQEKAAATKPTAATPPVENTKSSFNFNPNLSSPNFKVPEITNVFKIKTAKEMTFTTTKTIMPFPDTTKDFTFIRTVYSQHVIDEARSKIKENRDPQEALISAFKILKDYYKKLMWIVRDQKGMAFPIASNDEWNFTEDAWNLSMNFKVANPFRIAKFTQKPYHGKVFKNPVNDLYFQHWNGGKYPEIMTIIPLMMGGKVFGYFVGCDKGAHYHPQQTLEIMETVCSELVETFVSIHKELVKPKKGA